MSSPKKSSSEAVNRGEPFLPLLPSILPGMASACFLGAIMCVVFSVLRPHPKKNQAACTGTTDAPRPPGDTSVSVCTHTSGSGSSAVEPPEPSMTATGRSLARKVPGSRILWGVVATLLLMTSMVLFVAGRWTTRRFAEEREVWLWQLPIADRQAVMQREGLKHIAAAVSSTVGFKSITSAF